ncbi:hypothetical protein [Roseiconus lacunae]|uniref:hypothetical protein n=1 Tax=Roseiconus lacunae TaxID=2605694 RepID=UPI001E402A92|nr:hypothetical protein [Roseiconus lacunae]
MAIRSDSASNAPEQRPISTGYSQSNANIRHRNLQSARRRKLKALVLAGSAALILAGSTGCSIISNAYSYARKSDCLDDFMLSHRNRVFAQRAWFREEACHAGKPNLPEFKAGFIKGYIDVANGGSGCSPSVAPNQYWGWKYQSPGGQAAIGAFFAGYPWGAKAAEQDGLSNWSNVRPHQLPAEEDANAPKDEQPATPEPAPVMYGPDGMPLQEYIVPGSEVEVILPNDATPSEILPEGDLLLSPQDGAQVSPSIEMLQSSDLPVDSSSNGMIADYGSRAVRQASSTVAAETYTLQDTHDETVDEQSIEGIFGTIEMPSAGPQSEPNAETANADPIPFKFE